jgi:hypothetical protein
MTKRSMPQSLEVRQAGKLASAYDLDPLMSRSFAFYLAGGFKLYEDARA